MRLDDPIEYVRFDGMRRVWRLYCRFHGNTIDADLGSASIVLPWNLQYNLVFLRDALPVVVVDSVVADVVVVVGK
jgi:hypothetical protein